MTLQKLVHPKEETYFIALLVISVLIWIVISCFAIFFLPFVALFGWLANGLFVAQLRSESVEVTETQLPALHRAFRETCDRLAQTKMPRLYVLQAGGLLNAFATRFCARDFVVLYSDIVEATGTDSCEMRFILGHEIGHVRRKHLLKELILLPGLLLPLIGNAYRRSRETTCDRYGMFAANDARGAVQAMMMLAGGREAKRLFLPEEFADQAVRERGFFVSWHELLSSYPTLSRRVADLLALERGEPERKPKRHPLAYVIALFSPSTPGGGVGSLIVTVIVLFYLAMVGASVLVPVVTKLAAKDNAAAVQGSAESDLVQSEVREDGVIETGLIGEWIGSSPEDSMTWTTKRMADGTLETIFDEATDDEFRQLGDWRVVGDTYYELLGANGMVEFEIIERSDGVVKFVDEGSGPDSAYVERRK